LGQYGNVFRNYLEKENLLQYFSFGETQDNYKITKPDPRYFLAILEKCNCNADESIMVGDRIDKDIIPAKLIGMKTIRIKVGIHKKQEPRIIEEIPDLTVENIKDIKMEDIKAMDYCA
jgi:putative hydrolase of the HAD superfamily